MDAGAHERTPRAFLTDFGLAKSVATGSKLTRTGHALGTPAYMSPEQARGELSTLGPSTDVWSAGCVLYEALAGHPAFRGDTTAAVVSHVLLGEPARILRLRPDVPRSLGRVLRAALAKESRQRLPAAGALRDDLDRVLRGEPPRARPPRSAKTLALAGAGALVLTAAALAWRGAGASPRDPPRERSPVAPAEAPDRAPARAEDLAREAGRLRALDPGAGQRLLGEALDLAPGRHDWRLERGLLLWALNRTAEAHAAWDSIPEGTRERARGRFYAALEMMFRYEGASLEVVRTELAHLVATDPVHARLARGALRSVEKDWASAREALRGEPGWEAALIRGYVEGVDPAGDNLASVREFTAGLAEGIPLAAAFQNRAISRYEIGDVAGAVADFTRVLELSPGDWRALRGRAWAHRDSGDLEGAREDASVIIAGHPDLAEAWRLRAEVRGSLHDLAGAISDAEQALRLAPGDPVALLVRGIARANSGDLLAARADLDSAIAGRPGYVEALRARAEVRGRRGDAAGEISDLEEAAAVEPGDPRTRLLLGHARKLRGFHAEAMAEYEAVLRVLPESVDALWGRGDCRRQLLDFPGAIEDLTAALRARPEHPEARAALALARMYSGDEAGAASDFREFLRVAPGHALAADMREFLRRCEEAAAGAGAGRSGSR